MKVLLYQLTSRPKNKIPNGKLDVPKKYQERFGSLQPEEGLIDDCKYMLYFAKGWALGDYQDVPVKSKKEALEYLKAANRYDEK